MQVKESVFKTTDIILVSATTYENFVEWKLSTWKVKKGRKYQKFFPSSASLSKRYMN
jgi:hypothetical protein